MTTVSKCSVHNRQRTSRRPLVLERRLIHPVISVTEWFPLLRGPSTCWRWELESQANASVKRLLLFVCFILSLDYYNVNCKGSTITWLILQIAYHLRWSILLVILPTAATVMVLVSLKLTFKIKYPVFEIKYPVETGFFFYMCPFVNK